MRMKLAAIALLASLAPAATVGLSPASAAVIPGDMITLDLTVGGLGTTLLGAFDIDVSFDPTLLALNGVTPGSVLGAPSSGEVLDFSLGLVAPGIWNILLISTLSTAMLEPLQSSDPLVLATFEFTVGNLLAGATTIVSAATVNALGDADGALISVSSSGGAELTNLGGIVVPEPSGLSMSGIGLLLCALSLSLMRSFRR